MSSILGAFAALYNGKKAGFVGAGVSNMPIIRLFCQNGVSCRVRDKKDLQTEQCYDELTALGVELITGDGYLEGITEDILFLSPAVRDDKPEIVKAKQSGCRVTTELNEFFRLCPCKIIGVTGSDGKTTTTTLIAKLLEESGYTVHLGGNIGKNLLLELDKIQPNDFAVVEISSFQLMKMEYSPSVACVTNVAPNHLDWHTDMQEYIDAKRNIYANQDKNGVLVLNYDNEITRSFASSAFGKVRFISGNEHIKGCVWFNKNGIYNDNTLILNDSDIVLVGKHNRYNYAMAIAATKDFISAKAVFNVASSFCGVEHRNEFVRELDGVRYYNSSIDSSPSRTKAFLESFDKKVIIICGGYDKHIPLEPLGELFQNKAKHAILIGATAPKIKEVLNNVGYTDYSEAQSLEEAVGKARAIAENGDAVLLSPACASFDMFKNFAQRGNRFKEIVNELK